MLINFVREITLLLKNLIGSGIAIIKTNIKSKSTEAKNGMIKVIINVLMSNSNN